MNTNVVAIGPTATTPTSVAVVTVSDEYLNETNRTCSSKAYTRVLWDCSQRLDDKTISDKQENLPTKTNIELSNEYIFESKLPKRIKKLKS